MASKPSRDRVSVFRTEHPLANLQNRLPFFPAAPLTPGVISKQETLTAFAARLRLANWVALDTEADSLHSYPQKLCLLQVSIPGEDALVDPLAGLHLQPLWEALDHRELILHGADYDLRLLSQFCSFVPHQIFDTMVAARLLGWTEFALHHLARALLGLTLDKGVQKANWSRRPLTARMIEYARNDTRHLHPIAEHLRQDLDRHGRLEWHAQTCARLVQDCSTPDFSPDPDAWRIKGANRLDPRALAILRGLWRWREATAIATGHPPYFVLSHELLLLLAERSAKDEDPAPHIPRHVSASRRTGIRAAIESARNLPPHQWPARLRPKGERLTHAQRLRWESLERRRNRHAAALHLDPTLIASKAVLVKLAADWDQTAPWLLPWQRELLASDDHPKMLPSVRNPTVTDPHPV